MKGYLIKVTLTAKETNEKHIGETQVWYHLKGGVPVRHEDIFNKEGKFIRYYSDMLYTRKWQCEKEAAKAEEDEAWWYHKAECIEVEF